MYIMKRDIILWSGYIWLNIESIFSLVKTTSIKDYTELEKKMMWMHSKDVRYVVFMAMITKFIIFKMLCPAVS
jgi:hypothetical protein